MVVKRIATGPIDQPDVGIGQAPAVVIELLPGRKQQVGNRGYRNEIRHRIHTLREGRQGIRHRSQTRLVHRTVAVPETSTRKPELAEHRCECHAHPRCLFTVFDALQRPRDGHQRPAGRHSPSQVGDELRRHPGDLLRPARILRYTVGTSEQVILEAFVADAEAVQEIAIVQVLRRQDKRQGKHDCHVGSRNRCDPLAVAIDVVAQRTEGDDLSAAGTKCVERPARRMIARTTGIDAGVLDRHSPERDEKIGVLGDDVPRRGAREQLPVCSDHTRHDDTGGTERVAVDRLGVSTQLIQKSVNLALRVMESAGAGPAVRAAEDRVVSVRVDHATQFTREEFGQFVPGDRDEFVGSTSVAGTRPVLEPTPTHRRARNTSPTAHRTGEVPEHRRRIRITLVRMHGGHLAGDRFGGEHSPMGHVLTTPVRCSCHRNYFRSRSG